MYSICRREPMGWFVFAGSLRLEAAGSEESAAGGQPLPRPISLAVTR
jgi:hypothetical protein